MTTDRTPRPASPRRWTGRRAVAAAVLAASLAIGGCASDPPDPAQQRKDRVQARLEASFSKAQATCIMKVLKPETITALDKAGSLPQGDELAVYSAALVACVGGG